MSWLHMTISMLGGRRFKCDVLAVRPFSPSFALVTRGIDILLSDRCCRTFLLLSAKRLACAVCVLLFLSVPQYVAVLLRVPRWQGHEENDIWLLPGVQIFPIIALE